ERRDVVREHALEERHSVRARRPHDRPEAEVDERGRVAERGVLRAGIAEAAREDDVAVGGVRRATRGEVSVQRRLAHPVELCAACTALTSDRAASDAPGMAYEDILSETREGVAWITINRPAVRNAFRAQTVDELAAAFRAAWADGDVGVVVLTGAGDKAFSSGGDQRDRSATGYGGSGIGMDVHALHAVIRAIPKPVVAMVNGYAIGGGHVLHVLCDLSIAADTAIFGQTGPRVGSVDPGFGTAYLARIVGEKKAREIWYL